MLDLANDIRSLSDFKRNTVALLDRLRETGGPLVLTVNGKAELVVQDAAAYQALLDRVETIEGIQRGLAGCEGWAHEAGKAGLRPTPPQAWHTALNRRGRRRASSKRSISGWTSRAPSQGAAWFNGLERAVLALAEHPERCPVAPESTQADRPIRVLRSSMPVDKLTAKDRERFAHARAIGAARATDPSAIVDARYDAARDALELKFRSGGGTTIPRQVVRGLDVGPRGDPRTAPTDDHWRRCAVRRRDAGHWRARAGLTAIADGHTVGRAETPRVRGVLLPSR